jgi:uncharacterized membrane protein YesL
MKGFRDEIQKAGAVILGALKDTYGYLGTVLLVSVVWFAAAAAGIFVVTLFAESLLVALPVVIVITSPLIGAGFYVTNLILRGDYVVPRDFIEGARKLFWRSLAVSAAQVTLASILVLDIVWFLARPTWLSKIVALVFVYVLLFVVMVSTYLFPVIVNQDVGFRQTLKNAALLTLANPFYSLIIAVFQVGVAVLSLRFVPPVFCMAYLGFIGLLGNRATVVLLKHYGVIPDEEEEGENDSETAD